MLGRLLGWRLAGIVSATAIVVIFVGCMSLQFGGDRREEVISSSTETQVAYPPGDGPLEQTGLCAVPPENGVQVVYYPIPYISPPNLSISGSDDQVEIIEQKREYFKVRNKNSFFVKHFTWKANGVKILMNPPPPPVVLRPPAEAPVPRKLPLEPVPITAQP